MTATTKKRQYFGLIIYASLFGLVSFVMSAAAGPVNSFFTATMWILTAFWAFRGQLLTIKLTAAFMLLIKAGTLFYFIFYAPEEVLRDVGLSGKFGDSDLLLLTIAILLEILPWFILLFWPINDNNAENILENSRPSQVNGKMSALKIKADKLDATDQHSNGFRISEQISQESQYQADDIHKLPNAQILKDDNSASKREKGMILVEYVEDFRLAFEFLFGLPESIVENFLVTIADQPSVNPYLLAKRSILTALDMQGLDWTKELYPSISIVKSLDQNQKEEFFRVFSTLTSSMSPLEIIDRVANNSCVDFCIINSAGKPIKLVRAPDGTFQFRSISGIRSFSSTNYLIDYFGVPKSYL